MNRFLFKKFETKYKPTVEDLFSKDFDLGAIEIKVSRQPLAWPLGRLQEPFRRLSRAHFSIFSPQLPGPFWHLPAALQKGLIYGRLYKASLSAARQLRLSLQGRQVPAASWRQPLACPFFRISTCSLPVSAVEAQLAAWLAALGNNLSSYLPLPLTYSGGSSLVSSRPDYHHFLLSAARRAATLQPNWRPDLQSTYTPCTRCFRCTIHTLGALDARQILVSVQFSTFSLGPVWREKLAPNLLCHPEMATHLHSALADASLACFPKVASSEGHPGGLCALRAGPPKHPSACERVALGGISPAGQHICRPLTCTHAHGRIAGQFTRGDA